MAGMSAWASFDERVEHQPETLGAEGVLPSGFFEGFLRDFKQLTHTLPSGQIESFFKKSPPL